MKGSCIGDVVRGVALHVARGRVNEATGAMDALDPEELEAVVQTAEAEGLLALLAAAGRHARRHPDLGKRGETWMRDAIRRDLAADRVLHAASDLLDRAGVLYLLLKGACFRDLLYPAPWLRAMADVDLLVRRADLERAVRALAEGGFWPRTSYPTRPFSMRFSLERQVDAPGWGLVELHAGPSYEPHGLRVDIEGVFSRAMRAPRGPAPSWEDHLLLVAIHQARTGMLAGVRPFLDLALLIETQVLDWADLTTRAASWGCSSAVFFSLEAVRCLFGCDVPAHVLARTAPRGGRGALLRAMALRGAGDPVRGRLRAAPIPRNAPAIVFDLWRPSLYALLLDHFRPRLAFLAWVAASRAADRWSNRVGNTVATGRERGFVGRGEPGFDSIGTNRDNPFMKPRKSALCYRFRDDVAWREVEGVYHVLTSDNTYHCVQDEVGALILRCVETGSSVDGIVRAVEARFETAGADVRGDVRKFLSELVRRRVLTCGQPRTE